MQDATLTAPERMSYLEQIRRFPILKADEEHTLAARWRERGDRSAANQLVTSHLRRVVKIAMGYRRYGLPICDLISEGNIGLMQAIRWAGARGLMGHHDGAPGSYELPVSTCRMPGAPLMLTPPTSFHKLSLSTSQE
jgi:hypothetical protein